MSYRLKIATIAALAITALGFEAKAAEPYRLGYITDFSGPFVETFKPVFHGFELYMKKLNESGGINGHAVEIVTRDDKLNAQNAATHARELITGEKVNSLWAMSMSSTLPAVYNLSKRFKVPAISSVSAINMTLPPAEEYAYSTGNPFEVAGEIGGKLAAQIAPNKGMLVCVTIESAGGFAGCGHTEAAAKAEGFQVEKVFFAPRAVEFGPLGQKIADTKPAVVVTHLPAGLAEGILISTRAAAYKGPVMFNNVSINEANMLKAMEKAGYDQEVYTFTRYTLAHEDHPAINEIRKTAEKFGMSASGVAVNHVIGWVQGMLAEAALKKCGWPCSGEDLDKALVGISVDTGGLTGGPIAYTTDDHQGTSWWKLYKYESAGGKFKAVSDWVEAPSKLQYTIEKK